MGDINYREILERLADAVIVADETGIIVYANAACKTLLGWPADRLIGQPLVVIQPARMQTRHAAGFERYLRTRESRMLNKPTRVPAMHRDGREIPVELTLSIHPVGGGKELIAGSLRDLSDKVDLERQQTARSEAEIRADCAEFLDQAGVELTSSLDYEATLSRIAQLAVPKVADWCVVDIVDAAGGLQRLAVTHSDPAKEAMAEDLGRRYPPSAHAEAGAARVVRTGEAELVAEIPDALLASIARDDEHLQILRGLGLASYISVPLKARGRTVGVLSCIAAESDRQYGPDDLTLFEGLARHAGQAIDNARLFGGLESEIAKREEREARLASVSRLYALQAAMIEVIVRAPDQGHLFAEICKIAVETGGFQTGWVGLIDFETKTVRPVAWHGVGAGAYVSGLELALNHGDQPLRPTVQAIRNDVPAFCNDIADESQIQPWRESALARGYRASAALPLHRGGQVIGAFNLYSGEPGFFNAEEIRLFADVAENISFALDAFDRDRRRSEAEDALRTERAFLAITLENLKDGIIACDADGDVTLFNRAAKEFHGLPVQAEPPDNWAKRFEELFEPDGVTHLTKARIPLFRALAGESVREAEIVVAPPNGDRRVVICNGQTLYDNAAQKVGAVTTMHDITARKQAEARLVKLAFYDPLTGLPNRRLLMDRLGHALERAKRGPSSLAALFIDLDRLKMVNDSLGHEAGDEALILIARRLQDVTRGADTVARLGGDEFVVLCEDIFGEDEAVTLSRRIERAVAQPCRLEGPDTEIVLTASIGIAFTHGDAHAEDLLRNADTAMYRAKHRGKARHVLFDDALHTQAVDRLSAENALRQAIENGQLRLLYQPIVDLENARLIGAEALVRYQHPERGLVMPDEFLNIAEDSGLIIPLGNWVLEEACRWTCHWRKIAPSFQISVNLSARQLGDPKFTTTLNEALRRNDMPPGAVALEITESVLLEVANSTQRILQELTQAGPCLGIDDFGTGYSSLTYLRRFPVDFVKIDRSFVRGLGQDAEDTAIVKAVIELGKALQLTTIAEGVETMRQADLLQGLECDRAQGFYFARPQSADTISAWLRFPPTWPLSQRVS